MSPEAYEVIGSSTDRAAWLKQRRQGIGASDAPAILGFTHWSSPLSLYDEKTRLDEPDEGPEPSYRRAGRLIEPVTLAVTAEDTGGISYELRNELLKSKRSPVPMLATMDGQITYPDGTRWCELKGSSKKEEWQNGVPDDAFAQVQHQLYVTDEKEAVVGLFFTGFDWGFGHAKVTRDDDFIESILLPAEEWFWSAVLRRDPTDLNLDGEPHTLKALAHIYPADPTLPSKHLADEKWLVLADELDVISEQAKELEERKHRLKAELQAAAKEATQITIADGRYFNYKPRVTKEHIRKESKSRPLLGPFGKAVL